MATLGERSEDLQGTFTGRISRRLSLLLGLIFVVVLLIGGVSLLAARSIYLSTEDIERQGRHVEAVDAIHAAIHHLISAVQQSIITGALYPEDERQQFAAELNMLLEQYADLEETEGDFPEREGEMRISREIRKMIADLLPLSEKLFNAVARRQAIDRRDLEHLTTINTKIPDKAHEMVKIHRIKIERSIQESWKTMWLILSSYLALIVFGSLLILGSNLVFYKTIVLPIRRLASATLEVARGDFQKRVPVTSQDEIGQLSHAFNAMAEKLEEHEKKLKGLAVLEERERIAREMHDGLAQALGSLLFKIRGAALADLPDAKARGALHELEEIAEEAYTEVRQSIFGLRTRVTRSLGLIPTLAEYLHDLSKQSGIVIDLQVPDEAAIRLSFQVEIQLIRVIQEALTNVRRHAQARCAWVSFRVQGEELEVVIGDDGRGFDLAEVQARGRGHFGLQTMRERIQAGGGKLDIETAPGKGTKVFVMLPLLT
ncbi:MAG: HAMP domain-containing protein [Candidatus Methylomirabilales bacterium]